MYWKLFREMVERFVSRRLAQVLRTGAVTLLLLVAAGLLIADYEKGRGNYTKLKNTLIAPDHNEETQYRPGGREAIVLSRSALAGDPMPEFLSMTLLPGRGMDVLQITANVPGKGEVKLLASTDLPEAAGAMSGTGEDELGEASLTRGGPMLVPWAGRLGGAAAVDGKSVAMVWAGRKFWIPTAAQGGRTPSAYGGLLLKAMADNVDVNPMPDGGSVTALFNSGESDRRWPSQTQTKISALLASKALELGIEVKNTGDEATPVGVGWAPRFLIPSGQRDRARLRVPALMREATEQGSGGMPTGDFDAVKGTAYDFNVPGGAELGSHGLDDTFANLSAASDAHPTVELRDPAAGFGVRISALSPTIKAVHVSSPANGAFVTISPQMNYDDPFGGEWKMADDTGMVVLQPGQTVEWKVRVELVAILPGLLKGQ